MKRLGTWLLVGVLVALAAGVGIGVGLQVPWAWLGRSSRAGQASTAPASAEEMQQAFVQVASRVRPAVVNIATSHFLKRQRPPGTDPFSSNPGFK